MRPLTALRIMCLVMMCGAASFGSAVHMGTSYLNTVSTVRWTFRNSTDKARTYAVGALTGADASLFSIVHNGLHGQTLAPGQTAVIEFRCMFSRQGTLNASMPFTWTGPGGSGSTQEPIVASVLAEQVYDLGARHTSEWITWPIYSTNTNSTPCTWGSSAITGPDSSSFVIVTDTISGRTINPGQQGKWRVKSTPTKYGVHNAYLEPSLTWQEGSQIFRHALKLRLTAVGQPLNQWGVGSSATGIWSKNSPFGWTIEGSAATYQSATISGPDAAAFRIKPNPFARSYAVGERVEGVMQFKPLAERVHRAIFTCQVASGDYEERWSDELIGTGLPKPEIKFVDMLAKSENGVGMMANYAANSSDLLRKYRVKFNIAGREIFTSISGMNRGGNLSFRFGTATGGAIPKFDKHTSFTVTLQAQDADGAWIEHSSAQNGMIPLPVVIVPGIDIFSSTNVWTGDGEFPALESFLTQKSKTFGLGPGYALAAENPAYPTISTVQYQRNNSTFQSAGLLLKAHIAQILAKTHANKVIVLAHSKGTLVTRFLLSRTTGYKEVKGVALACGPHTGAFSSLVAGLYPNGDYVNLNPIYPSRYNPQLRRYEAYPNPELQSLNLAYMPATVPVSFYVGDNAAYAGFVNTPWIGNTSGVGYTSTPNGDAIVPLDSQRGELYGPGMNAKQRIIAFNTLPPLVAGQNYFRYPGYTHNGFMERAPVMNSLWDQVVLRYGNQ